MLIQVPVLSELVAAETGEGFTLLFNNQISFLSLKKKKKKRRSASLVRFFTEWSPYSHSKLLCLI